MNNKASPNGTRLSYILSYSPLCIRYFYLDSSISLSNVIIVLRKRNNDVNVIRNGVPSRILIVLLISLEITTQPKPSILLTIPVTFHLYEISLFYRFVLLVSAKQGDLYFFLKTHVFTNWALKRKRKTSSLS